MYEFHYDYIKEKYPEAKLLFTDTDSLCYDIPTEDIYKDMEQDAHLFDTSNYQKDHSLHSTVNKKVLGKMKYETAGVPIEEFVGPKIYSLLYGDGKDKRTAKGITRADQTQMKHEQYKTSLFQGKATGVVGHIIRSNDHELYSEKVRKVAISPFDDKRYVDNDGVTTLAHGHSTAHKRSHPSCLCNHSTSDRQHVNIIGKDNGRAQANEGNGWCVQRQLQSICFCKAFIPRT